MDFLTQIVKKLFSVHPKYNQIVFSIRIAPVIQDKHKLSIENIHLLTFNSLSYCDFFNICDIAHDAQASPDAAGTNTIDAGGIRSFLVCPSGLTV